MNDIRFAFRKLLKSPAFTSIAIITLALGIGLNTAIFSLINDLFPKGLPFKDPARVLHLYGGDKSRDLVDIGVGAPRFRHFRDGQTVFESLAGENFFAFTLTGLGDAVQVFGGRLTSNYFDVLGVHPILGRNFLPEEEEKADVALLTKKFWQKRLGGEPNVLGRSITLDGVAHTIVSVLPNMPANWFGANPVAEVWTTKPFQIPGFSYERMMRGTSFLRVVGRLKPGVSVEQARAALPSLDQSYRGQFPNKIDSSLTSTLRPLPQDVTENFRAGFITLFAAVCFVLLIACSNVANLLLVRFSGRRREIALRMAIGASRWGVVRLFVFESVLVSAIAGFIGAFVAWQLVPLVPRMASNFLPLDSNTATSLSLPVLLFTIRGDVPLNGGNRTLDARGDRDVPPIEQRANGPSHDIAPRYFKTLGISLLTGREFNEHDTADSQKVCLISQAGAKKVYPGENPIGKTLLVSSLGVPYEIVGIVGDVRSIKVNEAPGMEFYLPWAQENFPFGNITVRTNLQTEAVTKLVQSALNTVNPGLAIAAPQTMEAVVAQALGQARLMTWLLGIFAGVALLLAR